MKNIARFGSFLSVGMAVVAFAENRAWAQANFVVNPGRAFEASFQGKESYQYQPFYSTNMADWLPAGTSQVSTGGMQRVTFPMTSPQAFFRVLESPPDLSRRIVGLTNFFFDNAVYSAQGGTITLSGFRVQSRDYTLNDYLRAYFAFDPATQTFSCTNLQVFPDVGVVCGQTPQYFIKDATNALSMTNTTGGAVLTPDVSHTISTTGQPLVFSLRTAQEFTLDMNPPSVNIKVVLTDPNGVVLANDTLQSGLNWYLDGYGGLTAGNYTLQLIPQGVTNTSVTIRYHNANGKTLTVLTNGMNLSTSLANYSGEYSKFAVTLMAGQTLQLNQPGTGAELDVYNSHGVKVYGRGGLGALIFQAPASDTYYIIYNHSDIGTTHNYSSTVSITSL